METAIENARADERSELLQLRRDLHTVVYGEQKSSTEHDPLVQRWLDARARGESPDLLADLPASIRERLAKNQ